MIALQTISGILVPLASAVVGGVVAIGGNAVLDLNQRRIERNSLRRLLSVEASNVKASLDNLPDTDGASYRKLDKKIDVQFTGYRRSLRHPQFNANRADLKMLSGSEIDLYFKFYDQIDRLSSEMDSSHTTLGKEGYYHLDHARAYYKRLSPHLVDVDKSENIFLDLDIENPERYP